MAFSRFLQRLQAKLTVSKARFEAALLRERGPPEKPAQSGIRLKLNMKPESHTPTSTPKLKLTLRNPRISPDTPQSAPSTNQTPRGTAVNGNASKTPHANGLPNGRNTPAPHRSHSAKVPPVPRAVQHNSPAPTPPVIETPPQEIKTEPNGISTRNRRSPAGTPKPTKILPVRKSRTPALLPEADSITVVPRTHQSSPGPTSHLSPPAQAVAHYPVPADSVGTTGSPAAGISATAPGEFRTTMSLAVQPSSLPGYTLANGIDPRFRPPGKGTTFNPCSILINKALTNVFLSIGVEDALIANITAATHPNLKLTHAVEHNFPAEATKSFQNHVVFFEAPNNILLITLTLGSTVQGRPYSASITVNGHRLFFSSLQPNPNRRKEEQPTLGCDVRLIPGRVTHIEVMVIAGQKGAKAGMGEQEQEKFTLDAFLQYE